MIQTRVLDYAVSIGLIGLGIYVALKGSAYGYLDRGIPAAGFFPFWIGFAMAVLSAFNLYRNIRGRFENETIPRRSIAGVFLASAAMAGFIFFSGFIGMLASIFFLMIAIGALFGPVGPRFYVILIVLSAAMTGFLYLVFGVFLQAPLV